MALSTTTSRVSFAGDGTTVAFAFPYAYVASADFVVTLVSSADVEAIKTLNTHYTVTGAGLSNGVYASATITMTTAPASSETLVIERVPSFTQSDDFDAEADPLPVITRAVDRLYMELQALRNSSLRFSSGMGASFSPVLPTGRGNAGAAIGMNGTETGYTWLDGLSDVTVSSVMQTLLQASSIASAAAQLGSPFWFDVTNPLYGVSKAGTGSANYTALNLAIAACNSASGGTIYFPEGSYSVTLPDATSLTSFGAGTRLKGAGRYATTLTITCTTTTSLAAFGSAGNFQCEDIKIVFNVLSAQTAWLLVVKDDMEFRRCEIASNCDVSGGSADRTPIFLNVPGSGTHDHLLLEDCYIHDWNYSVLRSNVSTAVLTDWSIINCRFEDNSYAGMSLNAPKGSWTGIAIIGCKFGDQAGQSAGAAHMLGFSCCTDFRVVGCEFNGTTNGECIHIEENCTDFTIANNVMQVTSSDALWGGGILLLDNNVSGTRYSPQRFSIVGNTIRRTGTTDGYGIHLLDSTNPTTPLQNGRVADNIITGFSDNLKVNTTLTSVNIDTVTSAPEAAGALWGNTLSNNGSDATNDIDISAGYCVDSTNAAKMTCTALTKQLDVVWAAGTAAGFLDGGSVGNNTYHIYRILRENTMTVDALASLSHGGTSVVTVTIASPGVFTWVGHGLVAGSPIKFTTTGALPTGLTAGTQYYVIAGGLTADAFEVSTSIGGSAVNTSGSQSGVHTAYAYPVLPANYNYFRRIGSVIRSGGANLAFTQNGDEFLLKVPVAATDSGTPGTSAISKVLQTPKGIQVQAIVTVGGVDATPAAATYGLVTALDQTDTTPTSALFTWSIAATGATAPAAGFTWARVRTDTSSSIRLRVDASTADLTLKTVTHGWIDNRGRLN